MKLVDKIKNYFCDDEEEEAPKKGNRTVVEDIKPKIEVKDEKRTNDKGNDVNLDAISERELFKSDPTFNFPIIFDDEDFKDEEIPNKRITPTKVEQTRVIEKVETKVFKPSPNISPIYGIIDNDVKVETTNNNDNLFNLYEENKKVDIDDVLGKVYSQTQTRVEIKRETYSDIKDQPVKETKDEESFDFFNNIDSTSKEEIRAKIVDEPIKSVDEKLKSIDELLENTDDEDFYSLVDSMYKENEDEGDK